MHWLSDCHESRICLHIDVRLHRVRSITCGLAAPCTAVTPPAAMHCTRSAASSLAAGAMMLAVAALLQASPAVPASVSAPPRRMRQPFAYHGFSAFPASFFGANPFGVENRTQMALVARHQLSGWGWQAGCSAECGAHCDHKGGCPELPPPGYGPLTGHADEEVASYDQAKAFRSFVASSPASSRTQGVFVYRQMCDAVWWYKSFFGALMDPQTRGFFLTSDRTGELCWQSGGFFDFRNASAIDWCVVQNCNLEHQPHIDYHTCWCP